MGCVELPRKGLFEAFFEQIRANLAFLRAKFRFFATVEAGFFRIVRRGRASFDRGALLRRRAVFGGSNLVVGSAWER